MVIDSNIAANSAVSRLPVGNATPARYSTHPVPPSKPGNPVDQDAVTAAAINLDSPVDQLDATWKKAADAGPDIEDTAAADESTHYARTDILTRSAAALLAQGNLSPAKVFSLLQ